MQTEPLRILQIGAGSMGSRRLRDLSTMPGIALALMESRPDRRERAALRYPNVTIFDQLEPALRWQPAALSISTPPDHHETYVRLALQRRLHHFCEANIWTCDPQWVENESRAAQLISAPSNSLHFLPVVQELGRVVRDELGVLHAYQMALNTYMPDWHPQEGTEYYARNRNTAAGREMVPFELLWLNEVFGPAQQVQGMVNRRGSLPGVQEDVWSLQMRLANGAAAQLVVLMGCPGALRQGWCFGEAGQVFFDLFAGTIRKEFRGAPAETISLGEMKDVLEQTYFREIQAFVEAVRGQRSWPNSYSASALATAALAAAESSETTSQPTQVSIQVQPRTL